MDDEQLCYAATGGFGPLRSGAPDQALSNLITGAWKLRFDRYSQLRHAATGIPTGGKPGEKSGEKIEMSYIGG